MHRPRQRRIPPRAPRLNLPRARPCPACTNITCQRAPAGWRAPRSSILACIRRRGAHAEPDPRHPIYGRLERTLGRAKPGAGEDHWSASQIGVTVTDLDYARDVVQALSYDCSKGQCPTSQEMRADSRLMKVLNGFFERSQKDGREFGAYLVMGTDRTVRIGPSGIGQIGRFDFRAVLGRMPANTIAELHTHPDEGGAPGGAPFSGDYPSRPTIYSIVMNRDYIWFLTPWDPPGFCFPRYDGGPSC